MLPFYPIPLAMLASWRHIQDRTSYSTSWHRDRTSGRRSFLTLKMHLTYWGVWKLVNKQETLEVYEPLSFTFVYRLINYSALYSQRFVQRECCGKEAGVRQTGKQTHTGDSNLQATFPRIRQLARRACRDCESCALDTSGLRICRIRQGDKLVQSWAGYGLSGGSNGEQ